MYIVVTATGFRATRLFRGSMKLLQIKNKSIFRVSVYYRQKYERNNRKKEYILFYTRCTRTF